MKNISFIVLFGICNLLITSCSSVVSATHKGPLVEDEGSRTWGHYIDDGVIESKAEINLSNTSQELADARIVPISFNGIVLLVGQVSNANIKQEATDIVKNIRHVKTVENQLEITETIGWSQRLQDRFLASKIKFTITADTPIKSRRINVVVEDGVVYLMGLLKREEAQSVIDATSNISGINRIIKVFEYLN